MRVRNVFMAAAVAAGLAMASVASAATYAGMSLDTYAGTGSITRITNYYGANGGEFTIYNSSLNTGGYDAVAKDKTGDSAVTPSFQTFCVEAAELISIPQSVKIVVSQSSSTGAAGSASRLTNLDLADETAYLYSYFAKGLLAGYDYTPGAGRIADAVDLQKAIWAFEGAASPYNLINQAANPFVIDAIAATTVGVWVGKGIGDVRILNLWTTTPTFDASGHITSVDGVRQDMLYVVPLPASVWSAGALFGLVVFARVRKMGREA